MTNSLDSTRPILIVGRAVGKILEQGAMITCSQEVPLAYKAMRKLSIPLSSHNIVTLPRVTLRTEGLTCIGLQNDKTTTQDFNSSQILVGDHAISASDMQARFVWWLVIRTLQATIYRLAPKIFCGVYSALMSSSQASILM
jgi:hypothetical protein